MDMWKLFHFAERKYYEALEWVDWHTHEKQKCPYNYGQSFPKEGRDWWDVRNNDRVCSFCGSWHPDEFLKHIEKVIEERGREFSVELNDSRDKIYVHRPGILAKDGANKFRLAHLREKHLKMTKEQRHENITRINEALKLSHERFMERFRPKEKHEQEETTKTH